MCIIWTSNSILWLLVEVSPLWVQYSSNDSDYGYSTPSTKGPSRMPTSFCISLPGVMDVAGRMIDVYIDTSSDAFLYINNENKHPYKMTCLLSGCPVGIVFYVRGTPWFINRTAVVATRPGSSLTGTFPKPRGNGCGQWLDKQVFPFPLCPEKVPGSRDQQGPKSR